jgi:hypothetical protein
MADCLLLQIESPLVEAVSCELMMKQVMEAVYKKVLQTYGSL